MIRPSSYLANGLATGQTIQQDDCRGNGFARSDDLTMRAVRYVE